MFVKMGPGSIWKFRARQRRTPDLAAGRTVLGTRVPYERRRRAFQHRATHLDLRADEINRATRETPGGCSRRCRRAGHPLPTRRSRSTNPFLVLATQNPGRAGRRLYAAGSAARPVLDDAARRIPSQGEEVEMLQARLNQTTIERRVSPSDVNVLREFIHSTVYVDKKILEYIVRLGRATRDPGSVGLPELREMVQLGISPRSYQHLLALSRVKCVPARPDVGAAGRRQRRIFCDATRHRIARTVRAQARELDADADPRGAAGAVRSHDPEHVIEGELRLHSKSFNRAKIPQQRVGA